MTISVTCACGKTYKLGDDKAGKRFKCRECGEPVRVPEAALDETEEWDDWGDEPSGEADDYGDDDESYEEEIPRPRRRSGGGGKGKQSGKKKGAAKGGSKAPLWIGIGVAAVVLIGGGLGLYFALNGDDDNSQAVSSSDADDISGQDDGMMEGDVDGGVPSQDNSPGGAAGPGTNPPAGQLRASAPQSLEGEWTINSLQVNGANSDPRGGKFIVEGNTARFGSNRGQGKPLQMTVNWQATPATLDLSQDGRVTSQGILQVQGNQMTICLFNGGEGNRPDAFSTSSGDGRSLMIMQRPGGPAGQLAGGPGLQGVTPNETSHGAPGGFGGFVDLPLQVAASAPSGSTEPSTYLTDDFFATISINAASVLKSPLLKELPIDEAAESALQETMLDFRQLESVQLSVMLTDQTVNHLLGTLENAGTPPTDPRQGRQWMQRLQMGLMSGGFNPGDALVLFVQFQEGVDLLPTIKQFGGMALGSAGPLVAVQSAGQQGREYVRITAGPANLALFMPDSRTVVLGGEGIVNQMLDNAGQVPTTASLSRKASQFSAGQDIAFAWNYSRLTPHLDRLKAFVDKFPLPPPQPGAPTRESIDEIFTQLKSQRYAAGGLNLSGDTLVTVDYEAANDEGAQAVETQLRGGLAQVSLMYAALRGRAAQEGAPPELLSAADQMLQNIKIERSGPRINLTIPAPEGLPEMVGKMMTDAVQAGRGAAQTSMVRNNLKQIGLAMFNYHDAHQKFPQNSQLSWRVHILPFLEEQALYNEFNLNEPWDSPTNKALLERMPMVYAASDGDEAPGMTRIVGFADPKSLFGGTRPLKIQNIVDGTSLTLAVIQCGPEKAVPWTQPTDLAVDPNDPIGSLGSIGPAGFPALFVDASVRMLRDIDGEALQGLITINGGEIVDIPR